MDISTLPIHKTLVDLYERKGLTALYPPQAACVDQGLFSGKNLLVAIPTASGKTLVAEMAMHHHIADGGKCLYIVPLKALASEKFEEFSNKGVRVGISTGDFDRRDDALGRNDIIVATSEKVDSLMRNRTPWLTEITLLVVDEIHLIDSPDRGATLEMVITKFRYRNPRLQILGLSATIGNPASLAGWLDAELVTSRWRPVPLREGVYYRGVIYFTDGERPVAQPSKFDDLNLCLDTVAEGGQCLVFVSSRRNAEAFAKRAATALRCSDPALTAYGKRIRSLAETEGERILADCVISGAAFHHAGLSREERSIVEEGFRKGSIRCIASTPTLAAGLNLPARRVIIRDYLRFQAHEGMLPIPVREYHQMAGRAGRPHLDPYGEAVLIAKNRDSLRGLCEYYIEAPPEDVVSRCAGSWALGSHILSLITTQFAASRTDVSAFLDRTFYRYQKQDPRELQESIEQILGFIISAEMVTENGGRLSATAYGDLVSQLYLDPRGAETITTSLRLAEQFSTVGMLQRICSTPDMPRLYVRKNDMGYLDRFVCEHDGELWVDFPRFGDDEIELFYESLKTAMLLADWIDEVTDETICERYGVGQGDIYSIVESVKWLTYASTRLSRMFAPQHMPQLIDLERRIRDGVRAELLPLVRLRGIGRVRARRLFNNGITSPAAILDAGRGAITPILGRGITEQIFRQLEKEPEPEETDEQMKLDLFGGSP